MARPPHRLTVVVAGGDTIRPADVVDLDPDRVVAADSGLDRAIEVGLTPDIVVGDMDSVSKSLEAHAGRIDRHPVDKDATDLELALQVAIEEPSDRLVVLGGGGGRFDHLLANTLVLSSAGRTVEWRPGNGRVVVTHDRAEVAAPVGATVSLIPLGDDVEIEATTGLRWSMADEVLRFSSTRGVSNEITTSPATVVIRSGVLALVLPQS